MRHSNQLAFTAPWIGHEHARELAVISDLLDAQPRLSALVQQDLLAACPQNLRTGRAGLTGDQWTLGSFAAAANSGAISLS